MQDNHEITSLLRAWQAGEEADLNRAFPVLYAQLRRQAAAIYSANPSHTLQPTALVHEAYLKLAGQQTPWENRGHFISAAALIMRRILVDAARSRSAEKRGGGAFHVRIESALDIADARGVDLLTLNEALDLLSEVDAVQAKIVELRFFGGLSAEETAAVLNISSKTVLRGWNLSRAWLQKYLEPSPTGRPQNNFPSPVRFPARFPFRNVEA